MSKEEINPEIDLYIFHGIEEVVVGVFKADKMLGYRSVSKKELGEKWVENFESLLKRIGITLENIKSIYLNNSFSTWNAARLITLFVKTIISFKNIPLYLREESQDKLDVISTLKSFAKYRKSFRKVDSKTELTPLYKKCPNINI